MIYYRILNMVPCAKLPNNKISLMKLKKKKKQTGPSQQKYWQSIISLSLAIVIFFIEVQLIHNAVLISALQKSDSVIHIDTFFFILFSIVVYHRILNIFPCAIPQDLVVYLFAI